MENVTEEERNPFGMRPPCPAECAGGHRAVFGYGDANADFHVIGDHPGVHGGGRTGLPFTDDEAAERIYDVLSAVELAEAGDGTGVSGDGERPGGDGEPPTPVNTFLSYLYLCCVPPGETPSEAAYAEYERFFDAELRGIAADVLLPVGARATAHVLAEYTAKAHRIEVDMGRLHGRQIRGRGFLVLPIQDPREWGPDGYDDIVTALGSLLATDYHQMVDLGRFLPDDDPYMVR